MTTIAAAAVPLGRPVGRHLKTTALLALAVTLLLAAFAVASGTARAEFKIDEFSGGAFNQDGTSATQASSHPYSVSTSFLFSSAGFFTPDGQMKDVLVDLPPGFIGNPSVVPTECTTEELMNLTGSGTPRCPGSSQVGTAFLFFGGPFPFGLVPVYNMQPAPGQPARFGFSIIGVPVYLVPKVRTGGDYGLTVEARQISQQAQFVGATVTFWGVPSDPSHDAERLCPGATAFGCASEAPREAFLTLPGNCSAGPQTTTITATEWANPDVFHTASFDVDTNGNPMAVTGCDSVPFQPDISVQPTSDVADGPTGLSVDLTFPTDDLKNPSGLAQANLKQAVVTLPEGMAVNPSSAAGLDACSPQQIDLDGAAPATCPEASKIGTVEIDTPLLDHSLAGGVYLAKQGENPFGSLLAIYIAVADEESGVVIKLAGKVSPNLQTGQLETTFDDNPQIPFSRFNLRFKGGDKGQLVNPPTCGTHTAQTQLSSWTAANPDAPTAAEIATPSDTFTIACPSAGGFTPTMTAGTLVPTGGAFSPFMLQINRPDRQEIMNGLSVEMPQGVLAKLRGVGLCPDELAGNEAAGPCPADSRIGTAIAAAGAGPQPYALSGDVYLTGPYKGAPYGLSVQIRAVAGPLDLGTVKVRQAIFVDPVDASLSVVSDPIPTIREGIPFRLRTVGVNVNRSGFTVNPTSCSRREIKATVFSQQGSAVPLTTSFQVGDCETLKLSPKVSMKLKGRKQTAVGKHPGLDAVVTQTGGQANLKKVAVDLPLTLALDPDNANALCEYDDGLKVQCPKASIIGTAKAVTPLLNEPLTGPVYFVKGVRFVKGRRIRTLPTLLIPLRGEIAIDLRATSTVKKEKLVTTFDSIPDAAISRFDLSLKGGKGGVLTVSNRSVCSGKQVAQLHVDGQNGKLFDRGVTMKTPCAKKKKSK